MTSVGGIIKQTCVCSWVIWQIYDNVTWMSTCDYEGRIVSVMQRRRCRGKRWFENGRTTNKSTRETNLWISTSGQGSVITRSLGRSIAHSSAVHKALRTNHFVPWHHSVQSTCDVAATLCATRTAHCNTRKVVWAERFTHKNCKQRVLCKILGHGMLKSILAIVHILWP